MKGKVYLVGAGPGDPDLLTLKALRLLQSADAILHDDLVTPAILKLVSPAAQVHNVGKRSGTKKITQEETNFLMTSLAGLGLTVVRLKSGDPLIFGRAGEEIEALRRAGLEYEVVPGVTAALGAAAAAGIPLTHRRASHAVAFLTGQLAAGSDEADWRSFANSGATLVIYMPRELGKIAAKLKQAGLDHEKPCALVSRATTTDQRIQVTTLANLAKASGLSAPSLLIVGEVVRFARLGLGPFVDLADQFPILPSLSAAAEAIK
ncbi:MAG: uroporphyrinogen-III C-methyltransferase [Terriglobales bacterium]